jgi:replicative DNA helicase
VKKDTQNVEQALYAPDAELALVGCANVMDGAIYETRVQPDDIATKPLAKIWSGMLDLAAQGVPINVLTIAESVTDMSKSDVHRWVSKAINSTPTHSAILDYERQVLTAHRRRVNYHTGIDLTTRSLDVDTDPDEVAAKASQSLMDNARISEDAQPSSEVAKTIQDKIAGWVADPIDVKAGDVRGRTTSFRDLNRTTGGLGSGFIVIGGHTHTGKTGLALQMSHANAQRPDGGVLYLTFEQGKETLQLRQACSVSGVSTLKVKSGQIRREEQTAIDKALDDLGRLNWLWYDGNPHIHAVSSQIHRAVVRYGIDLVIVDNLDYIETGNDTDYTRVSAACKTFMNLARRLDLSIVGLHQVNRTAPTRPMRSHLRDSGKIEETATIVIMIEENEADGGDSLAISRREHNGRPGTLVKLHVDKNKDYGTLGTVPLFRLSKTGRFYDVRT